MKDPSLLVVLPQALLAPGELELEEEGSAVPQPVVFRFFAVQFHIPSFFLSYW
jgi:hypothetical protein